MTELEKAARAALEALEHEAQIGNDDAYRAERDALRQALEQQPIIQTEIKEDKSDEPVACLVETEKGVMVWPIEDYDEAGSYCDVGEFPEKLYTRPAERKFEETSHQPAGEPVAWADKAMELASDLSIESLRLGSYERKDIYERSGRASWQTVEIRAKREEARERLRRHIYTRPQAAAQTDECVVCGDKVRVIPRPWVGLTDEEVLDLLCIHDDEPENWAYEIKEVRAIEAKLREKNGSGV